MCGIHGIITSDTFVSRGDEYMKDAFVANQLRGMHSSGLFVVPKDGSIVTHKAAVCGQDFITDSAAKAVLDRVNGARVSIGHVRHATQGNISDENAHPFLITREDGSALVGVHNGTLRGWKAKKNSKDIDVDSQWAFTMLAEHGNDAFKYFDGAFAFIWYDSRTPDIVYMARNAERPLHYMVTKDTRTLVIASELGMLGWLTDRNKIEGHSTASERFRFLTPGHIYKFNLKSPTSFTTVEAPKYDPSTTITPPAPVHQQNNWHGPRNNRHHHHSMTHYRGNLEPNQDLYDEHEWPSDIPFGMTPAHYDRTNEVHTEQVLREVADALRVARNANFKESVIGNVQDEEDHEPTDSELREVMNQILEQSARDDDKQKNKKEAVKKEFVDTTRFLDSPNDVRATREETEAAKRLRLYGGVVEFSGVLYDGERGACLGTTRVFLNGKWCDAEAEIRGISGHYANHRFIDPIKPVEVVIVGWNPNRDSGCPPYYVVEDLTIRQRNLLAAFDDKQSVAN